MSGSLQMDFFAHQDKARTQTRRFVLLYAIAVLLICGAMALIFGVVGYNTVGEEAPQAARADGALVAAVVAAVVTGVLILGGSAYRIAQLKGGGSSVAVALGGRQIHPDSRDADERRVLNVVEEMAIASGVPVPPVYLMEREKGINAFAAGYSAGDAVIGVTQGCVSGLTRDELQGVMAHEFSHILNGDMRLNIRMLGFLNGIVLLTIMGTMAVRSSPHMGRGKNGLGAMVVVLAFGLILVTIGSIGSISARLIQSLVSRQREYLADASAVQFTRNPEGIGNALRRIGGATGSTKIRHPRAAEAGHMFFGEALSGAFASHPPLKDRIKRVMPGWDGTFLEPLVHVQTPLEQVETAQREKIRAKVEAGLNLETAEGLLPLLALSGTVRPEHVEYARSLIGSIPEELREAAHDPYSGRAVVYALLLDRRDARIHEKQIAHLRVHADPKVAALTEKLANRATALKREQRLPLLDMTLGALASLSDRQESVFRSNIDALIRMDNAIDLFEWVAATTLTKHLDERFGDSARPRASYYALGRLEREVCVLFSALARAGPPDPEAAEQALRLADPSVPGVALKLLDKTESSLGALEQALPELALCSMKLKKQILQGAALVVGADRKVTVNEAELLRAIADAIGVPTPPLLPGQTLG